MLQNVVNHTALIKQRGNYAKQESTFLRLKLASKGAREHSIEGFFQRSALLGISEQPPECAKRPSGIAFCD